jgi:hypothetical protein
MFEAYEMPPRPDTIQNGQVGEEDTYTVLGSGDKLVSYVNDSEPNNKIESRIVDFIKRI